MRIGTSARTLQWDLLSFCCTWIFVAEVQAGWQVIDLHPAGATASYATGVRLGELLGQHCGII